MKRKGYNLHGTNFEFLKRAFPDLIESIEDGFFGDDLSKGPVVRKTIKFLDGSFMTVFELIETRTGKKLKYQYLTTYTISQSERMKNAVTRTSDTMTFIPFSNLYLC